MLDNIKLVIWDLDGTIIDSFGLLSRVIEEVADQTGRKLSADLENHFHGSLSNTLINVLSLDDQELDSVMSVFLDIQDKLYSQDLKGYLFDDTLRLMMEASRLGIRQTIVTNRGHLGRGSASPIVIAKKLGIDQYIDQIIPGDQTEYRKPDIRVLGNLTNDMMSDNILVIGDQIVDIEFAINLGAKSILVDRQGDKIKLGAKDYPGVLVVDRLDFTF